MGAKEHQEKYACDNSYLQFGFACVGDSSARDAHMCYAIKLQQTVLWFQKSCKGVYIQSTLIASTNLLISFGANEKN
jgi:hypothetical protein